MHLVAAPGCLPIGGERSAVKAVRPDPERSERVDGASTSPRMRHPRGRPGIASKAAGPSAGRSAALAPSSVGASGLGTAGFVVRRNRDQ
jgi:hypothetical protein